MPVDIVVSFVLDCAGAALLDFGYINENENGTKKF